jgi:arsenate reductase-like glutaredoxin family protein
VIANKVKIHRDEALAFARKANAIWVTKGKKLIQFDPSSEASDDEIAALILGRSGTLRAPAFHVGDTFMVGYSEEAYGALFS